MLEVQHNISGKVVSLDWGHHFCVGCLEGQHNSKTQNCEQPCQSWFNITVPKKSDIGNLTFDKTAMSMAGLNLNGGKHWFHTSSSKGGTNWSQNKSDFRCAIYSSRVLQVNSYCRLLTKVIDLSLVSSLGSEELRSIEILVFAGFRNSYIWSYWLEQGWTYAIDKGVKSQIMEDLTEYWFEVVSILSLYSREAFSWGVASWMQ